MEITNLNMEVSGVHPACDLKLLQRGRCQCELKDQLIAAVRELRKLQKRNERLAVVAVENKSVLPEIGNNVVRGHEVEATIDHLLSELDKLEVE